MEPFKDRFDDRAVDRFAEQLAGDGFDAATFREAVGDLSPLALKGRVDRIADAMQAALAGPFPAAAARVVARAPAALARGEGLSAQFGWWPLCTWVERHGLDHPREALDALEALTRVFSAEFAVRPFFERDLDGTLARAAAWADSSDPHLRRLASEGARPLLPWGRRLTALQAAPERVLPLLERLVDDPVDYVRLSVANHLGDIAKSHPDVAVAAAQRWRAADPRRDATLRHALRHLLKRAHPGALALFALTPAPVRGALRVQTPHVALGGALEVALDLVAEAPADLRVDLAVRFRGADGALRAPKVFRWADVRVEAGATTLTKRLPLRAVTTRSHYAGEQGLSVQVNGARLADATFVLSIG